MLAQWKLKQNTNRSNVEAWQLRFIDFYYCIIVVELCMVYMIGITSNHIDIGQYWKHIEPRSFMYIQIAYGIDNLHCITHINIWRLHTCYDLKSYC